MSGFDTVISNGLVIDGTAAATPRADDVGIVDGRIAQVGDLSRKERRHTLDAAGRVVAPGFIDTHTHAEIAALAGGPDRFAPVAQGVTTMLSGADGFGWVGLEGEEQARWWRETMSIYGTLSDPPGRWAEPSEFVEQLRSASIPDVIPMIPHNNVRAVVMGPETRAAGPDDMKKMHEIVDSWLEAGAVGMASGLDYLPGRYSDTDELVELCEHVAEAGGVYASHLRLIDSGRAGAWREAGEIGHRAGLPIRIAHERLDEEGAALLDELSGDVDVTIDSYLYPAGCTSLAFHVPPDLAGEGVDALIDRLRSDPEVAASLADHLRPRLDGGEGRQVIVAGTSSGRHEGRTLAAIAEEAGKDVGVVGVELLISEAPAALLIYAWQAADATWDQIMRRTLEDPRSMIASDGIYFGGHAHPRGFGTFPRVLGQLVRDKGLVGLGTAVHKMSGKPAEAYGLSDRGVIEPGRRADLVVFDPVLVSGSEDFDRPRRPPIGIETVLIQGETVREKSDD